MPSCVDGANQGGNAGSGAHLTREIRTTSGYLIRTLQCSALEIVHLPEVAPGPDARVCQVPCRPTIGRAPAKMKVITLRLPYVHEE